MTSGLLTVWIEKAVRGLREEDQKTHSARFIEKWRRAYEGFLASGKSEEEARSLALALMGNAREARARLRRTVLTQAEWDYLSYLEQPAEDGKVQWPEVTRRDKLTLTVVVSFLVLPVFVLVPSWNLIQLAGILLSVAGLLFVLFGPVALYERVRIMLSARHSRQTVLLCLTGLRVVLYTLIALACDLLLRDGGAILNETLRWFVIWGVWVVPDVLQSLRLARKLSRLEDPSSSLPGQAHPAV